MQSMQSLGKKGWSLEIKIQVPSIFGCTKSSIQTNEQEGNQCFQKYSHVYKKIVYVFTPKQNIFHSILCQMCA